MQVTYPSKNISDLNYFNFSQKSYENLEVGRKIYSGGSKWMIIERLNNPDGNGVQAIVVAPVVKNKLNTLPHDKYKNVDVSEIVIAFRGTEFMEMDGDKTADVAQVILGTNYIPKTELINNRLVRTYTKDNQFKTALVFAKDIVEEYKTSDISLTGHSLGGAEAQYIAAELDLEATTYAAPNVYPLLSDEAKARVDDGTMRGKVRDYTHDNDIVGLFSRGAPLIGKQYVTAANEKAISEWGNPVAGHFMETFTGKFQDGNIEFMMEPKEVIATVKQFQSQLELLEDWKRLIQQYIDDDAHEIRQIYKDMLRNINGSGDYPLLNEQDVIEVFREKAQTEKGGDYYLIDVDFAIIFCDRLSKYKQELEGFLEELVKAAETTGTLDLEISEWFGGNR